MKGDSTTHTYTAQGRENHDKIKWGKRENLLSMIVNYFNRCVKKLYNY